MEEEETEKGIHFWLQRKILVVLYITIQNGLLK